MKRQPTSCGCAECKKACSHQPGVYLPEQVTPAMMHSGQAVVRWIGNQRVVTPATTNGKEHGDCVHLQDGKCSIYATRPYECAAFIHGDTRRDINRRLVGLAAKWAHHGAPA